MDEETTRVRAMKRREYAAYVRKLPPHDGLISAAEAARFGKRGTPAPALNPARAARPPRSTVRVLTDVPPPAPVSA